MRTWSRSASIDPAAAGARPLAGLKVLPPVQPVGTIIAAGANYREHVIQMSVAHKLGAEGADAQQLAADAAAEIDERGRTGDPYVWTGIPSAVCGAYDDVQLPDVGGNIDWELELGVVIGRKAHRVAAEDAFDYVAGYTIVNDVTARALVPRNDIAMMGTDWFRSKNQPTFFPTGPYVVPTRFVPDPAKLRIRLSLNGQLMQDALADDLLFDIPSLIAYASSVAVLQPGDVLITGSPAGNGSHWGRFLRDGDVMEAEISGSRHPALDRSAGLPGSCLPGTRIALSLSQRPVGPPREPAPKPLRSAGVLPAGGRAGIPALASRWCPPAPPRAPSS